MSDFDTFINTLKIKLPELAKEQLQTYAKSAIKDGDSFINETKENLKNWTNQLAEGELTKDEFEWFVKGQADLAKVETLKQAGVAAVQIDQFRNAIIDLIVGTACDVFL